MKFFIDTANVDEIRAAVSSFLYIPGAAPATITFSVIARLSL